MGLFELFKRQNNNQEVESIYEAANNPAEANEPSFVDESSNQELDETTGNQPRVLTAKLFFVGEPEVNPNAILEELQIGYPGANMLVTPNSVVFSMPLKVSSPHNTNFECCLLTTPGMALHSLPREAYKQNWHWKEASSAIQNCAYEVLLTEKHLNGIGYKERTEMFIDFICACIVVMKPEVIYSKNAEKLLEPRDVLGCRSETDPDILHPVTNIRMFKMPDSPDGDIIMDTTGLSSLGLPELEIIFHGQNPARIAELLLRYCYFIYDIGDNVQHGEYLEGLNPGERWKCERRKALLEPERVVLRVSVA